MATLMDASRQWMARPEDERFTSLTDLHAHCAAERATSVGKSVHTKMLTVHPISEDSKGLVVVGQNGVPAAPTHFAFGQLAQRAGAPAGYLRDLPAPLAADCINFGLATREVEDIGVLLRKPEVGPVQLSAVTGPGYGRVWNETITKALIERFGDGITGDFRVPGEFGKEVAVTKANTTLYASDRDMWVFLADERNRIEVPNRRDGKPGMMARGFFVWNSEVGAQTFGVSTFLFDYVCKNRIVWGAEQVAEIRIRHTSSAPWRWIQEVAPAIQRFAEGSASTVTDAIAAARAAPLGNEDKVQAFLANRFTRSQARAISAAHLADEGRPIETIWDAVNGVTAYARSIPYQDERVQLERAGGALLKLAA